MERLVVVRGAAAFFQLLFLSIVLCSHIGNCKGGQLRILSSILRGARRVAILFLDVGRPVGPAARRIAVAT